ncbi:MAG TPA: bifunctional (p)ppGpp synthetase/guanosine-3',5'-bis(diphosphate) 3'-pyrophosphohydrolase [Thermoanaerobaculia bacterium]|nr:bifunctional (p)ppGpp synthetase/guanosine-3',5'-bis(diphosphate) 3'-pyrophosphohydrolase [Thermoanaerobaculia bacterium]
MLSSSVPPTRPQPTPPVSALAGVVFDDLLRRLRENERHVDEPWLRGVYELAQDAHQGQVRRSGEPYISHPLAVAYLLADLKFDQICVAVGLLHDVLEDTGTDRAAVAERFGPELAELVDGVSKIGRHSYVRRDEAQAETYRKLVLASAKDLRVIVVKLVDRLHNMQTLEHMSGDARRRISRETLEIYAPIAHRLGMSRIRGDLEDLAFYHLYPHQFGELQTKLKEKVAVGEEATRRIRDQLARALGEAHLDCEISHRVKAYFSIWRKLLRQGIDISELYDYLAFRVITGSVRDCYAALGVVHQSWRPLPGRFKDYIAVPKPNLYQSLHTTVVGELGTPFEIQIRTHEMDVLAEEGIAAHWRYKEGKLEATEADRDIIWLRHLLEWQQDVPDPRAFLKTLKIDLYPDEVYVFTPKGEVMSFPRGATSLDFAYRVHTELGHHCAGARVSGRLVPLRTPLKNGDIVEILTNPNREPSQDWLSIVVTPRARSKIRNFLNAKQKHRAIEIGRALLEKELRRHRLNFKKALELDRFQQVLREEGLSSADDLLSRIGFGKTQVRYLMRRVLSEEELARADEAPGPLRRAVSKILPFGDSPVTVRGEGDMLAFLARCCKPLPGDEIVGYVTRGRGVSVHSTDCPNVRNLLYHPEREIEVGWSRADSGRYEVALAIEADDQPGVLARLTEAITRLDSNIRHLDAQTHELGRATIQVVVEVRNRRHLEKLRRELGRLSGIVSVRRRIAAGEGPVAADAP